MATMILSNEVGKSGIPIESGEGTFELMGSVQRSKLYQIKTTFFFPTIQPTKFAVLAYGGWRSQILQQMGLDAFIYLSNNKVKN